MSELACIVRIGSVERLRGFDQPTLVELLSTRQKGRRERYADTAAVAPLDQGDYAKANVFLRYLSDRDWTATVFVRNLTDKVTKTSASVFATAVGAPIGGSVSDPRIFGVKFDYQF